MNWSQRMNLAIAYIEENLCQELRVEDVAKKAFCSKYHFHRMFFARFKISCAEYIRRRKLTLAAADLINTDLNVLDVALKYGYESPNAFTRAFNKMHGVNPGVARSNSVSLSAYSKVFFPENSHSGEMMDYKIVERPEFRVLGKSKRFRFEQFVKEGPKFWKGYVTSDEYKKLSAINKGMPGEITGAPLLTVYFPKEDCSNDEFIDVLGIEAGSEIASQGFEAHDVPSARYAEFNCTYKTSMKTNRYIYGEWFASTGYERDSNKPDVVAYFPMPWRPMGEMHIRWWIPIKAANNG